MAEIRCGLTMQSIAFVLAAQAYSRHEPAERSRKEQGTLQLHIESSVGVDQ